MAIGPARCNAVRVSDAWCGSSRSGTSTYTARAASCPVAPEPLSLADRNTSFKPARRTRVWCGSSPSGISTHRTRAASRPVAPNVFRVSATRRGSNLPVAPAAPPFQGPRLGVVSVSRASTGMKARGRSSPGRVVNVSRATTATTRPAPMVARVVGVSGGWLGHDAVSRDTQRCPGFRSKAGHFGPTRAT